MKTVRQIDLTLKNEPGALSVVSDLLGENRINIIALYVTTDGDIGKIHFVANDPDKAVNVLKTAGYHIEERDVIACEVPHHPGGLNAVLRLLKDAGINVDYIYPCIGTGEITILIMGMTTIKEALNILDENWMRTIGTELYHM
ncbi:MAG: amino acid-binding protein [Deltaproteobacteria bacterium]|nr:amino acid-binding protein [Deltaproteobacteria bacterium]MBN2687456.1 amino acid-binding protein [Deltaproteobacteria bacterium]